MSASSGRGRALLFLIAVCAAVGCAAKVQIREITDAVWFQRESRTALESIEPSERTMQFLRREGLVDEFFSDRMALLETLHDYLVTTRERMAALHLSELCYYQARQGNIPAAERTRLFLSSCQYAYSFLFDSALGKKPSGYDPAFRWACDFYNRSLAKAIDLLRLEGKGRALEERRRNYRDGRVHQLLDGELWVQWRVNEYGFDPTEFADVLVAFNYDVQGLPGMARSYGLGVPLILVKASLPEGLVIQPLSVVDTEGTTDDDVELQQSFASTAILRMPESIVEVGDDAQRRAWFELYDPTHTAEITIAGEQVPLEQELSTALAHTLQKGPGDGGLFAFLRSDVTVSRTNLSMLQPYDPEKIPVVFVHGLMSSPMTWVGLFNDLLADEELRYRYQFWFFRYSTGFPVTYSASLLRETLLEVQRHNDPEGDDPAFQNMLICGHSMGGLLTKLQIIDGGQPLWDSFADQPFEEVDLPPQSKETLRRIVFFQHLPFVKRAVFMAVPHRGSELATSWIGRFGASLVSLPRRFVDDTSQIITYFRNRLGQFTQDEDDKPVTGIRDLEPTSWMAKQIGNWPLPERVPYHSIIGNQEEAGVAGGSDGVVPYASAHLEGAQSELIVKSGHNVQEHPLAIKELRRILHLHLEEYDAARAAEAP